MVRLRLPASMCPNTVESSVRNRVILLGGGGGPYPKLLAGLNTGLAHDLSSECSYESKSYYKVSS